MSADFKIFGHRGCRGVPGIAENSLPAFDVALQHADGIELDVFLVKDGSGWQLAVCHGEIGKLTDYRGDMPITALTWDELKDLQLLDASGKPAFDPSGNTVRIPTLDDVLDRVRAFRLIAEGFEKKRASEFIVNIEVKYPKNTPQHYIDGVADTLADIVKKRRAEGWHWNNFQISCFNMDILRAVRDRLGHSLPIGVALSSDHEPWDIGEEALQKKLEEARDIHPQTVNITLPSLTPHALGIIRGAGYEAVAWTHNETDPKHRSGTALQAEFEQLRQNGVCGFITDYPETIREKQSEWPR